MKSFVLAGLALGLVSTVATAGDVAAGDWLVRVGYHTVNPKSDNASVLGGTDNLNVGQDSALTFNVSYFFTDAIAVELQAATPFNHDISVDGAGKVGATKHLPPTLNVQYHFDLGAWKPYVGAGVNWTIFFDENTTGVLAGADLDLDDSFGLDVQLGVDYSIGNNWFLNAEARWIDIDSDAVITNFAPTPVAFTVEIDPFVYALTVGRKF